jgi:two-component system, NarL family, capsular synthesis sensor histidine kinase RcsC
MYILYVEDDPNDAQLVTLFMRTTPHDFVVVSNPEDAQPELDPPPQLILVDVILNNSRTGYNFARDLRSQGYSQPMIAVTALSTEHDRQECYSAGFTTILNKPFTINQLAEMIAKYSQ